MKRVSYQHVALITVLCGMLYNTISRTNDITDMPHKEVTFKNTTNYRIEIGYLYKPSKHSPSVFLSLGYLKPQESSKKAVRLHYRHIARHGGNTKNFSTSSPIETAFTPLDGDNQLKISLRGNSLSVDRAS